MIYNNVAIKITLIVTFYSIEYVAIKYIYIYFLLRVSLFYIDFIYYYHKS